MIITSPRSLVITCLLRLLEIGDVPDEGHGSVGEAWVAAFDFVVLVVQKEVLLPIGVENPALVRVGCSFVGCYGDYFGPELVGCVI